MQITKFVDKLFYRYRDYFHDSVLRLTGQFPYTGQMRSDDLRDGFKEPATVISLAIVVPSWVIMRDQRNLHRSTP
jgi:hypothetical protein